MQWEVREGPFTFTTVVKPININTSSSALCSEHFGPEDFDRADHTVRIRDEPVPSVFSFPAHLQKTSSDYPLYLLGPLYALPSSSDDLRARLIDALDRVESLEIEKRNAKA
ncbi:uncharacterized protein FYW61_005110 [Anableps anableps]